MIKTIIVASRKEIIIIRREYVFKNNYNVQFYIHFGYFVQNNKIYEFQFTKKKKKRKIIIGAATWITVGTATSSLIFYKS